MMFKKPIITHNYPPIPFGSYYEELGCTIHISNEKELIDTVNLILIKDKSILELIENRRNEFLMKYLNIDPQFNYADCYNELPTLLNMKTLIEELF